MNLIAIHEISKGDVEAQRFRRPAEEGGWRGKQCEWPLREVSFQVGTKEVRVFGHDVLIAWIEPHFGEHPVGENLWMGKRQIVSLRKALRAIAASRGPARADLSQDLRRHFMSDFGHDAHDTPHAITVHLIPNDGTENVAKIDVDEVA